jgi:hypothetical protein
MMNVRRFILLFVATLALLGLVGTMPVKGKPTDAIIVTGASSVLNLSVTRSTGLENSVSGVGPRFVVQYANSMRNYNMIASQGLISSTGTVGPRFVVQYANSMRNYGLSASQGLINSTAGVEPRIIMQYANSNRNYSLHYPAGLIGDNIPPQITSSVTYNGSGTSETINWTTNEFAQSVLYYGTQSGIYPWVVTDTLYYASHAFNLAGLTTGTRYYFKIRSIDLSGNAALSNEYTFVTKRYVYLPLVLKNH